MSDLSAHGKTVVIIAHNPQILSRSDKVLFLKDGTAALFGPRDEVLPKLTGPGQPNAQGGYGRLEEQASG